MAEHPDSGASVNLVGTGSAGMPPPVAGGTKKAGLLNRFDNPWLNWKFLSGAGIIGLIFFLIFLGNQFWDTELALAGSSPLNMPPVGFTNWRNQEGIPEHPLGTENSGRDMLALLIVGNAADDRRGRDRRLGWYGRRHNFGLSGWIRRRLG